MRASLQAFFLICVGAISATGFADALPKRIWIDTDAACGAGFFKDVDDCLAIALLLNNPEWEVVGISTVFGNASLTATDRTVRGLINDWCSNCVPVYRGASQPGTKPTLAAYALAAALEREPLVVFAFGPATNISTALQFTSALTHNHRFVAVAGTRNPQVRLRVSRYSPFRLRDLNFVSDPDAFEFLLSRELDLSLAPFELAAQVKVRSRHIDELARRFPRLAAQSRRWLWIWRLLFGSNGFHPFDAVAVSLLLADEGGLVCSAGKAVVLGQNTTAGERRKILHVSINATEPNVSYCHEIANDYADVMLDQLAK